MRVPILSRRTVVGLSATTCETIRSPFSSDGSTVTRKSGASATDEVIWQTTTCAATNATQRRSYRRGRPCGVPSLRTQALAGPVRATTRVGAGDHKGRPYEAVNLAASPPTTDLSYTRSDWLHECPQEFGGRHGPDAFGSHIVALPIQGDLGWAPPPRPPVRAGGRSCARVRGRTCLGVHPFDTHVPATELHQTQQPSTRCRNAPSGSLWPSLPPPNARG